MSSNVNYASINENFPVAGQDNDTQVFRDNFDTIKNSLSTAKSELTDLLDNSARKDEDNDFSDNRIVNAVFRATKELKYAPSGIIAAGEGLTSATAEINFENGPYQIYRFGSDANINFGGFSETNFSKITLEIYGNGDPSPYELTFITTGGSIFKRNASEDWGGTSSAPTISVQSSINPIILEVWRHDSGKIFLNYLGLFD
jgi:hypothetical protein